MTNLTPIRRALLSVSDKADLVPFARRLAELGVEIISTGGTARVLKEAGVPVVPVEDVTGFPEMMDGRVKTLHPAVHGALLGRRDVPGHVEAMSTHGIVPIDLVCINLYPFERTVRQAGVTDDEAIEQIDIGGPAMLRSAAKNHRFVTVVTSTKQYDRVAREMKENDGATTLELRHELAAAAFMRTAEYDTAISAWMGERDRSSPFPPVLRVQFSRYDDLRYGENPHQAAACYADPTAGPGRLVDAALEHGKPLSYNNLNDAAAAMVFVQELAVTFENECAAVLVKHTNPCGAAVASRPVDAFRAAYAGDPRAAYGGILAISQTIDEPTAESMTGENMFLEVVLAPGFDDAARRRLADRWKNVRLLALPDLTAPTGPSITIRSIPGGALVQDRDRKLPAPSTWSHVAGPPLADADWRTAQLAWLAAKHLSSNAIAIARDGRLLGGGAGQVDRVTACRLAVEKAVFGAGDARGGIAASDAFFPFPDGPALLIEAGVSCIVQPGGSKRDAETTALCEEHGVTCLLTGVRHFRH